MPNRIASALRVALALVFLLSCVACGANEIGSSPESSTPESEPRPTTEAREATAGPPAEGEREASDRDPVEVERSVVATGLEVPWGLAFLPGGDALFTERDSGRLLRMDASGNVEEVQTLPTRGYGEGGSLGLAVSPGYERDGYVYAYYTTGVDNRVVRFRLGEEPEPILTGIPFNTYHDGGRIAFGPDGMLYVATGDAGDPTTSQDRGSLGGKILRLTPDGGVPQDNPFPGSPVYSYGHRNVEGLAWDESGRLYASEFGQDAFDEVNLIRPGENYGWPEFEGDGGEEAEAAGFVNPVTTWPTSEASPSGAEILKDGAIPQWEGDLFVAALRGQRLWRLELGPGGRVVGRDELLRDEVGRIRNVIQAPDGSLWVTTSNLDGRGSPVSEDDRIIRLAPEGR
ncbi:MAG TPA: PQQ-dependent sugar dehydrogenase [Rubrobacteraceae bacterium]|nr:PQQ-dependent sugar dehydrogenase [Rubrobacteraceae bacterium]